MKGKTKRRIIAFIMTLAIMVSVPIPNVRAAEPYNEEMNVFNPIILNEGVDTLSIKPRTTMFDCEIIMAFRPEGLVMSFSTSCVGVASVIGVKDIKVQQKVWYGWKTVLTSDGAENQNENVFGGDLVYTEAIKDKTYRVTCIHYADVNGYEEVENDTGAFKFTY